MMPTRQPAVFLDRDGTINREVEYLGDPARLELLPGAAEAIALLNQAGYVVVVVTNQAGIARGYYALPDMQAVHARLVAELRAARARVDAFYHCPHHPDFSGACACRKPAPGMLRQAAADLDLDLGRSWMVGDTAGDIGAGAAAGCRTILVRSGYGAAQEQDASRWERLRPDYVVDDLWAAARLLAGLAAGDRGEG